MRLTDEVPSWVKFALRAMFYGLALFLLYQASYGAFYMGVASHTTDCVGGPGQWGRGQALATTRKIAACIREKNNLVQNLMMRPIHRAIDGLPNHPSEFVGVWDGIQPRCSYRHILKADGTYLSSPGPAGCSLNSASYSGHWGVVDGQMIWLSDEQAWPPDINAMDVVDKDLVLLTEHDGTRTKFARATDPTAAELAQLKPPASLAAAPAAPPGADQAPAPKAAALAQWSPERVEAAKAELALHRFVHTALPKLPDWSAQLPPARLAEVTALLTEHRCTRGQFTLYSRPGAAARALVGHDCEAHDGEGFSEYPLVLIVTEGGVRRIDLAPYGFMYESGTIEAFTDLDGNGRLEIWLSGSVCECDGEPEEGQEEAPCDCQGTVVVEDMAAPTAPAARSGAQPGANAPAPSTPA